MRPTGKVAAATAGGAAATVLIWILGSLGVDVPGYVGGAFGTLFAFGFGYLKTE